MAPRILLRISTSLAVVLIAWAVLVATGHSATATQGQAVIAGQTNTETLATLVDNTSGGGVPCGAASDGVVGCGVVVGVRGSGGDYGVAGDGDTGVLGTGNDTGVSGTSGSVGVNGYSGPAGIAVWAQSSSTSGVALKADGKVKFSTAGMAVVPSGSKSVTVPLSGIGRGDFALATVQGSGAFFVKNTVIGSGQVTIYINKAPTSQATVTVAYFVISPS